MLKQILSLVALGLGLPAALAQPPGGGFGGPPQMTERKILKEFDKDNNGWLDTEERKPARALAKSGGERRGPRGGSGGRAEPGKPGPHVEPGETANHSGKPLYEPTILRTLFLTFENSDWEQELQDFHGTDVDVPCTLLVDDKTYRNVGVHFRGMSSYMGVSAGSKRSLNLSMDTADRQQRLLGVKTLNLLNCHEDDSFLSTVLYSKIARDFIPAPKANMVRVVINGELWGVYSNVQQFDKAFLEENYKTSKGTRWKVRGSPNGRGGLEDLGDKPEDYKRIFEIKSGDDAKAWKALINFCKVLNQTPPEQLEEALKPLCDLDSLLWFLALDVALINNDGYWTRASDYTIFLNENGKFHFIPHDMNEAFHAMGGGPGGGGPGGRGGMVAMPLPKPGELVPASVREMLKLDNTQKDKLDRLQKEVDEKLAAIFSDEQKKQMKEMRDRPIGPGGPGGPGGMGGGGAGIKLDPLVGITEQRKPLRSKVLAVPALKAKYLANVRTIAEKSLDWKTIGPLVQQYRQLLEKEIEIDSRKLTSLDGFRRATAETPGESRGRETSLRAFADQRRAYLLEATK